LEVSGSSNFHNSEFIVTGSTHFKGIHTISGSTESTGSFNVIDGNINIVSGSSFTRWGNKLFNYGQFSSTETQSGSANTAYAMKFNTNDDALNVHIVSSSRITVDNTGIYNLQFSSQLGNTANTAIDFDIWFAYTGSNIANSNTQLTLNKIPGSLGKLAAAWNFMTLIHANDYIEIMWSCTDATGQLQAQGTQTGPTRTENKVLTQEELQTLNTIQEETQALINELGEIELIKLQLEERRERAKNFLTEVSRKEKDFTQLVYEKYGRVNINPQTGEITSSL
jgi:hypothetical protein